MAGQGRTDAGSRRTRLGSPKPLLHRTAGAAGRRDRQSSGPGRCLCRGRLAVAFRSAATGSLVDANFKEDQLTHMLPGQAVTIRADVLPGKVFHGHLDSLAPATGAQFSVLPPENATGNFTKIVQRVPVRVMLDQADGVLGQLRPGLSVTAEVDTRHNTRGVAGRPADERAVSQLVSTP
ncbi:HlyD family secretion protein [Pseudomonas sp. PCH446]